MLLAYLDDALDPAEKEQFEAMLAADPSLQMELEQYRTMSSHLRTELQEIADAQDYSAMESTVLEAVAASQQTVVTQRRESLLDTWFASVQMFFRRPAMSFALGALLVGGLWGLNGMLSKTSPNTSTGNQYAEENDGQPTGLRAPEGEIRLVEVEHGQVTLSQRGGDPDAPTVIWYVSEAEKPLEDLVPDDNNDNYDPVVHMPEDEDAVE
ncbi:MAG: hypothetical protein CMH54_07270 [Myxococcales bacterium]|nr:hypothetical protein [Myxococcales bacterium]